MSLGAVVKEVTVETLKDWVIKFGSILRNSMTIVDNASKTAEHASSVVKFTISILNNLTEATNTLSNRIKNRMDAYDKEKKALEDQKQEVLENTLKETKENQMAAEVEQRNNEIEAELKENDLEKQQKIQVIEKKMLESKSRLQKDLQKFEIEQDKLTRLHEIAMLQQKQEMDRKNSWVIEKQKLDSLKDKEDENNRLIGLHNGYKDRKCKEKGYNKATFYHGLAYTYKIEYLMDGSTFIKVDYNNSEGYFVTIGGVKYKLMVDNQMKKKWYGRLVVEAIGKLERLNSKSDTVSIEGIRLSDDSEEETLPEIDTEKYQSEIQTKEYLLITKKLWFKIKFNGGKTMKQRKRKTKNKKNKKRKTRKRLR